MCVAFVFTYVYILKVYKIKSDKILNISRKVTNELDKEESVQIMKDICFFFTQTHLYYLFFLIFIKNDHVALTKEKL